METSEFRTIGSGRSPVKPEPLRICEQCKCKFRPDQGQEVTIQIDSVLCRVFVCKACMPEVAYRSGKPQILAQPDLTQLKQTCQKYINDMAGQGWADEDYPQWIFETAMRAFFGADVFKWINSKNK